MAEIVQEHVGRFNRRFVLELADGARIESVLYRGDTLCVSSQVGCGVSCPFCASGAGGFGRNLASAELRAQLSCVEQRGHRVVRATVSGVGEPLHNLAAVESFLRHCHSRRIGVSLTTSGGPLSRLSSVLSWLHNGVTISVHAGFEATRRRLVPFAPSLDELFGLLARRVPELSGRRQRKLAIAYLLVRGENDSDQEIDAFIERALPLGLSVHLYALNPVPSSGHAPVERARYEAVYWRMARRGLAVRMSSKARLEHNGGCGTLVALRPRSATGSDAACRSVR